MPRKSHKSLTQKGIQKTADKKTVKKLKKGTPLENFGYLLKRMLQI